MRKPSSSPDWPASWHTAYAYDLAEVFAPYARPRGHGCAYRRRLQRTMDMVDAIAPPHAKIIDIAAAQGNFSLLLAERGYDVTWNDLRGELAGYVQLKHEAGKLSFLPGDVFALGECEDYDVVIITEIIEHVAHPDRFLKQVATLLRPGGFIIMTTPNGEYIGNRLPRFSECADPTAFEAVQFQPDGDGHIFLLHRDEISQIAKAASLRLHSIELFTTFLSAGRLRTESLLVLLPDAVIDGVERWARRLPDFIARRVLVQTAACLQKSETESHAA